MNTNYKTIFTQSSCLTNKELTDYLSGNLEIGEIRKVELHIADCQMCNDELEGIQILKDKNKLAQIIDSLNNKIDLYFNKKEIITPYKKDGNKTLNIKKTFSIAASITLLITAGYFIYEINNTSSEKLAQTSIIKENILNEETEVIDNLKSEKLVNNIEDKSEQEKSVKKDNTINDFDKSTKKQIVDDEVIIDEIAEETDNVKKEDEELEVSNSIKVEDVTATTNKLTSSNNDKPMFGTTRGYVTLKSKKKLKDFKYLKDSGLLSYNVKSYKEAIIDFNKYLNHNPNDFEVVFKVGMSYYYLNNYNYAISKFNKIIATQNIKYFEDAQWFNAKCFLKQGKKEDAKNLFKTIESLKGKYSQKAKIELKQLN